MQEDDRAESEREKKNPSKVCNTGGPRFRESCTPSYTFIYHIVVILYYELVVPCFIRRLRARTVN